jgi:hypothetical protein
VLGTGTAVSATSVAPPTAKLVARSLISRSRSLMYFLFIRLLLILGSPRVGIDEKDGRSLIRGTLERSMLLPWRPAGVSVVSCSSNIYALAGPNPTLEGAIIDASRENVDLLPVDGQAVQLSAYQYGCA